MTPPVALRRRACALAVLLLGAGLAACSTGPSRPAPVPRTLVWSDDFDGPAGAAPDPTRWAHQTGGGGWGNGELQCYTDDRATSALDGHSHLVLRAVRGSTRACGDPGNPWTSARLSTRSLFSTAHGRLEVRARMPDGAGTWPAFWALGDDIEQVGWPRSGEIDVVEFVGNRPGVVSGSVHGATWARGHWFEHRETRVAGLTTGFHVFAAEWASGSITFSVDGRDHGRVTRREVEHQGPWVFDRPFHLLLNLAVGGTLGGEVPDSTASPQELVVDWVRVYR